MSYSIADYSEITGDKIFPFKVELDVPNCILNSNKGENQKFSYIITAVGSDSDSYADLEYIIFGIDEKITFSQLQNIAVAINGKSQNVKFNDNVILVNPDKNTRCAGLKFDFALNKMNDVLIISFELSETYEIGPIAVCLFGEKTTKTGLAIGGPTARPNTIYVDTNDNGLEDNEYDDDEFDDTRWFDNPSNEKLYNKVFNINVPVSIKPYVLVYEPEVKCMGDVKIHQGCKHYDEECKSFDFTITQKVSVKVPVKYGVVTHYDKTYVDDEETV